MRWILKNTYIQIALGISLSLLIIGTLLRIDSRTSDEMTKKLTPIAYSSPPVIETIVENPFSTITSVTEFKKLTEMIANSGGTYSLFVKSLDGSNEYRINDNESYYIASVYKVPVAAAVLYDIEQGNTDFSTKFSFTDDDVEEGSGIIQSYELGTPFTVEFLLSTLLKNSDNSAQLILENNIAYRSISKVLPEQFSGIKSKQVTAEEVAGYFDYLYNTDLISPKNKMWMFDQMTETAYDNRINTGLRDGLLFSHKIGTWPETGSWHDCGILFGEKESVVCLMSKNATYDEFLTVSEQVGKLLSSLKV